MDCYWFKNKKLYISGNHNQWSLHPLKWGSTYFMSSSQVAHYFVESNWDFTYQHFQETIKRIIKYARKNYKRCEPKMYFLPKQGWFLFSYAFWYISEICSVTPWSISTPRLGSSSLKVRSWAVRSLFYPCELRLLNSLNVTKCRHINKSICIGHWRCVLLNRAGLSACIMNYCGWNMWLCALAVYMPLFKGLLNHG